MSALCTLHSLRNKVHSNAPYQHVVQEPYSFAKPVIRAFNGYYWVGMQAVLRHRVRVYGGRIKICPAHGAACSIARTLTGFRHNCPWRVAVRLGLGRLRSRSLMQRPCSALATCLAWRVETMIQSTEGNPLHAVATATSATSEVKRTCNKRERCQ
jgi:hypothetical protein